MHKVLQNLADGREPFCANGTRMALIKRGLVPADMQLTPAGKTRASCLWKCSSVRQGYARLRLKPVRLRGNDREGEEGKE